MNKALYEAHTEIGKIYHIEIDRPIGSPHRKHPEILYPINYGYVPGLLGGDQEEQDVYVLDFDIPIKEIEVTIIAVMYREDDIETKWVGVVNPSIKYTNKEILRIVQFQEQYYKSHVIQK